MATIQDKWAQTQADFQQDIAILGDAKSLMLWIHGIENAMELQEELIATTRNDLIKLATQAVQNIKSTDPKKMP